ncbi:TIGR02444 family protein [Roseomonas rosea]|uniref:TIGR02444 family protein n=1 Tax=Muricoccus roseus TaxID=198092 RepID=A0A1M6I1X1_9PROT|nr:TIGR02444 family protein [Roseomonas rosea]SHJ28466.1 TIGR02444 family protein [Roseomonas rosea]
MAGQELDLDNAFWRFSCAVYAAPGVAQACLELQDRHGADVNLLLLAAWLGANRGVRVEAAWLAEEPGADWHRGVIGPLRQARRRVKAGGLGDEALRQFHAQLLACELAAERIRQAELFRWTQTRRPGTPPALAMTGLARRNLALLTGDPPGSSAALDRLAQASEAYRPEG